MKIEHFTAPSPKGEIDLYKITNDKGASVTLSSLGAGITRVYVPDRYGNMANVILSYDNAADYYDDGPCAGKVPGRYANRIAKGHFTLDGKEYTLAINNGPNALHGGPEGFQNRLWESHTEGDDTVVFTRVSPDGEEGYPGTVHVKATYTWNNSNQLRLHFTATTDAPTVVNLTNHAYWNLDGENSGSVLDHTMRMACHNYVPTDDTLIPTGEIAPVEGTPMDFTEFKALGQDIKADFPALRYGKGYDACWMVDDWTPGTLKDVVWLKAARSGRTLTVATTQPGAHVYTGNWVGGSPLNPEGRPYNDYDAVAIECQHVADSPNQPQFPSTELRPGETFDETILFSFGAE